MRKSCISATCAALETEKRDTAFLCEKMRNVNELITDEKGAFYQRKGQIWLYANNVLLRPLAKTGDIVNVLTRNREYLGTGFYHETSHISVRILTRDMDEEIDAAFFEKRIEKAISLRREVMKEQFDNCRLIYSASDALDGLIVDRYNDVLVTQISSFGLEMRKDMLYEALLEALKEERISAIYERNEIEARKKEGLFLYQGFYQDKKAPLITMIRENGLYLEVDMEKGQKTGYFLDQKFNRMTVQKYAKDRKVLDCFCHSGGFALNAAKGGAEEATGVDVSAQALKSARHNAKRNQLEVQWVQDDVFAYLKKCEKGQYDFIILDPPAFTKSQRTKDHAYQGYLEINTDALKLLDKKGLLATCSCSRYMEKEMFEKMLEEAAEKAGKKTRLLHKAIQSPDHPADVSNPASEYLKFYLLEIL